MWSNVVGPYDGERRRRSRRRALGARDLRAAGRLETQAEESVDALAGRGRGGAEGPPGASRRGDGRRQHQQGGSRTSQRRRWASRRCISLPLTLLILVFAFGALVAAGIPLLLALTSVGATMGLLGPVSQIAPVDGSVMHVVLLIGMAVGVDYSLFYIKRAREERAAGRENDAAIEAAAATSGRAVLISGLTVMVAMAGMYLGGISNFASFATGHDHGRRRRGDRLADRAARPALEARRPGRQGPRAARRPHQEQGRRGRHLVARPGPGAAAPARLGARGRRRAGRPRGSGARDADLAGR